MDPLEARRANGPAEPADDMSDGSLDRARERAWALVREVTDPTPLEPAPALGRLLGTDVEVLLKREDLGPNGSFKWRGALCACDEFQRSGRDAVVTASTGNHGAATAWAAQRLGLRCHVAVPHGAPTGKMAQIASFGAELHTSGANLDEAAEFARALAADAGAVYFEDGGSRGQIFGTETIGRELACAEPDMVIVPVACGALAAGVGLGLKRPTNRAPTLVGVQVAGFERLWALWRGAEDPGPRPSETFADGLADSRLVEPAFSLCRYLLDDMTIVDDAAIAEAIRELHRTLGIVVEGAGAAGWAGVRGKPSSPVRGRVVVVVTGRNLDRDLTERILGQAGFPEQAA